MPMTTLAKNVGFNPRGTRRYIWAPLAIMTDGVLDTAALTSSTTTDLTNQVTARAGFTTSQAQVPDPDMGSLKTGTVAGEITYGDSSLTFRTSKTGPADDVRAVLHEGDEGFLVIANEGLVAGKSADVVRATIGYGGKLDEDIARYMLPFIVSDIKTDVVIPALV